MGLEPILPDSNPQFEEASQVEVEPHPASEPPKNVELPDTEIDLLEVQAF